MKHRRKSDGHVNHERWLVSYADFVTLLFAFFVVLYASAQIDKKKAMLLSGAIESAFQQLGVFEKAAGHNDAVPEEAAISGSVLEEAAARMQADQPPSPEPKENFAACAVNWRRRWRERSSARR